MALPPKITYADKVDGALDATGEVNGADLTEIKNKFNALRDFVVDLVDANGVIKLPQGTQADADKIVELGIAAGFTTLDQRYAPLTGAPPTAPNAAPTAIVQAITGTTTVGQELTGRYTYADAENNPEGASIKQWFRADNASGLNRVAILGATDATYTLISADLGKYIQFGVTPIASAGTPTGTQVLSAYTGAIAAAPQAGGSFVPVSGADWVEKSPTALNSANNFTSDNTAEAKARSIKGWAAGGTGEVQANSTNDWLCLDEQPIYLAGLNEMNYAVCRLSNGTIRYSLNGGGQIDGPSGVAATALLSILLDGTTVTIRYSTDSRATWTTIITAPQVQAPLTVKYDGYDGTLTNIVAFNATTIL